MSQTFPDKTEASLEGKTDRGKTVNGQRETSTRNDTQGRWEQVPFLLVVSADQELREELFGHLCSEVETVPEMCIYCSCWAFSASSTLGNTSKD